MPNRSPATSLDPDCIMCVSAPAARLACGCGGEGLRAAVVAFHKGQVRESLELFGSAWRTARDRDEGEASRILSEWSRANGGRLPVRAEPGAEAGMAEAFALLATGRAEAAAEIFSQCLPQAVLPYDAAVTACWEATAWRWALSRLPFGGGTRRDRLLAAARRAVVRAARLAARCVFWQPHALVERAIHAAETGREKRARRLFSRAIRLAVERQDQFALAWATFERGRVGLALGWGDARGNTEDALLVFGALGIDASPLEEYRLVVPASASLTDPPPGMERFQRVTEAARRIVSCLDPQGVREEVRRSVKSAVERPLDDEARLAASFITALGEVAEHNARAFEEARSLTASLERQSAELRASLEEKDVMLKEIQHRVKNNLQLLLSLLNLQAGAVEDPSIARELQELENRVRSMALIQDYIYGGSQMSEIRIDEYLRTLTEHLAISFGVDRGVVEVRYDLERLRLAAPVAVDCGLMVTELVSNVFEHAFVGRTRGVLELRLVCENDGVAVIGVRDDGVGMQADCRDSSLGLRLVALLAEKLGGLLHIECDAGTTVEVRFKMTAPPTAEP